MIFFVADAVVVVDAVVAAVVAVADVGDVDADVGKVVADADGASNIVSQLEYSLKEASKPPSHEFRFLSFFCAIFRKETKRSKTNKRVSLSRIRYFRFIGELKAVTMVVQF